MKSVAEIVRKIAGDLAYTLPAGRLISLEKILSNNLEKHFGDLTAYQLAEEWLERLQVTLENNLIEWDSIGVPRPLICTSDHKILLTFRHKKYLSLDLDQRLPIDFHDVYRRVHNLDPTSFLLIPICIMSISGCDPIFVTDKAGDGGIDCIGQIQYGPTRSTCFFSQAKLSNKAIKKDLVMLEISKYEETQNRALFSEYLAALGKGISSDGRACNYTIVSNAEFEQPARNYALSKNILLRSGRQNAFWMSHDFGAENFEKLVIELGSSLKASLEVNLAPIVKKYRKSS
jgi:hypothetical protein